MADELDRAQNSANLDKRDLQKQKEAAVDAAFRNPFNTIIPIDLEDEMKNHSSTMR